MQAGYALEVIAGKEWIYLAIKNFRSFVVVWCKNFTYGREIKIFDTTRCKLIQKVNRAIGKCCEGALEMGSQIIANASKDDVL